MSESTSTKKPILLLGVGNILQRDDGVGVHIVTELAKSKLPDSVEAVDGGIAGLDLLSVIEGRKIIIAVDAVEGEHKPGTIFRFSPEDVENSMVPANSLHQIGLMETLQMLKLIGKQPEKTVVYGMQPGIFGWGFDFSDDIAEAIPRMSELVLEEVFQAACELEDSGISVKELGD